MAPHLGGPTAPFPAAKQLSSIDGDSLQDSLQDEAVDAPVPPHPLGIKPLGNKYLATGPDAKAAAGVFEMLPDELLVPLLEHLDADALRTLGYTCRFLYAFCTSDELWKSLALEAAGTWQPPVWHGTWRASLLAERRTRRQQHGHERDEEPAAPAAPPSVSVDCGSVFSDVLHRPYVCSHTSPARFARSIPAANAIKRLPDLTHEAFAATWSDTPFVLTDSCVRSWPVLRDWSLDRLRAQWATTAFRAESVDWPYALYDQYLWNTADESPLYLFDRAFAEKLGLTVGLPGAKPSPADQAATLRDSTPAYWPPDCFGPDLFAALGPRRPAHRWLIVGPARSGSTFHKDPNGTNAWNAVVRGAKYWIMFPPGAAVPGVFVSADKSEVTSPLSIAEWLLTFHAEARATPGCVEGVCRAGEILHVPSGWWHLVVNLAPGVALTQNFVPRAHLAAVLLFLRDRPGQVTGFARGAPGCDAHPYALFVEQLAAQHPALLAEAQAEVARRDSRRKRTWEAVVRGDEEPAGAGGGDADKRARTAGGGVFTFGFGGGDDDLESP